MEIAKGPAVLTCPLCGYLSEFDYTEPKIGTVKWVECPKCLNTVALKFTDQGWAWTGKYKEPLRFGLNELNNIM